MKRLLFICICLVFALSLTPQAEAAGPLTVDIHGPGQRLVNITLLPPKGLEDKPVPEAASKAFQDLVVNNLSYIPFLKIIPVNSILGGDPSTGVRGVKLTSNPCSLPGLICA